MFNLFPIYNPFLLQVLPQLYFTSTTLNKDLQKEQPFLSPVVLVVQLRHVHEPGGSRLATGVFHAARKTGVEKVGIN